MIGKEKRFVLVTGATGQQGGAVVKALLANGHKVRGVTRNTDSASAKELAAQGVEMVAGDFTEPDSLTRAATGVDTIFAMTTPFEQGTEAETSQGLQLIEAAKRAGVGHLVYSSVGSANQSTGIPHFDSKGLVEQAIITSEVPYTIIGPVFFMDNFLQSWITSGLQEGTLSMGMPGDRKLQQVAVADIGAFAAAVIERRDSLFGQRFDIAGDELNFNEVAAVLSNRVGREIRYEGFPVEALRVQNEDMGLMFEWFDKTGYSAEIDRLKSQFPEVKWHSFKSWAEAQDWEAIGVVKDNVSQPLQ